MGERYGRQAFPQMPSAARYNLVDKAIKMPVIAGVTPPPSHDARPQTITDSDKEGKRHLAEVPHQSSRTQA